MELLDDLLGLLEGIVDDKETLQGIIDSEGLEVLYDEIDPDAFPTMEGYLSYFGELQKKKEETGDTPVISPEENTESNTQTPQVEGVGSSDSSPTTVDVPQVEVPQVDVPQADVDEANINVTPNIEQEELPGILDPTSNAKKLYEIVDDEIVILGDDGMPKNDKEDETWLEESWLGQAMDWAFDDVPILGVLSADFWGDMYRAIGNGYTKGQSVDDSIALFAKGKNISDQDLQEYIAAVKKSENVTVSDEMKNFQKIYDENGGGVLGFILGFGSNLSIAPELLIDSLSSMINPASAAAAGAGAATGAATGAALTAVSGPGALFGTGAGAIGGAMGGASAALEFGMSYTEFMKEEVEAKGGKFDAEGIRMVLNDDQALQRIRNRAATRGLAIGMIDAMTAGVAGKAIGGTGKALAKGTAKRLAAGGKGTVTRAMVNKGIEISAGLGVEIAGGSLGEATARALAGQEMDVAEIGLEGFAGAGNAPISLARGIYTTPRYNLNGDLVTKDYMLATIGTATPDQIAGMNIEIKNDKKMQSVITDLKATSQFDANLQALGVPPGPQRDAIVKLELEKSKLPDARSEATRQRRSQIDQEINFLINESSTITETVEVSRDGNTFTEVLSVSKAEARAKLKEEGIESATEGQVSDMQKAMMEQLKNSDTQAEKAIIADQKIADDIKKEVEESITDQEVQDKINKDTYTDKEFDNAKQLLIKEKVDAIQESSTTQVDVQESSRDGEGVGEVNVQEEITEESPAKNEQESSEPTSQEEAEVVENTEVVEEESKPKSFETIPPSQREGGTQRFKVPGSRTVDVEVDAEGKAYAVNRKTGRPLKNTPPKAQEFILENVIDVNEGTPLQLDESTNLTPEQYTSEIAENSNNIKEVAETIDLERKRSKELSKSEKQELADPLGISSLVGKITEQQFIDANDVNNVTPNMRRYWFAKKQKNMFGKETGQDTDTRGLDDLVMELDGYTQERESDYIQQVVEFIIQNDTGKVKTQTGKSPGLVDLEIKFENLTGLKPTKRNIDTVLSIDPNREPNTLTDTKNKEANRKAASEPGVFTKGKRGINPKRITQGKKKKSTLVIDADGLVTQIKLESKAAKESEASYKAAQQRVLDQIKDLQVRGVVRAKQALVMTRKVLRTNFSKEAQVKNLSKYVTDVMNSATINDQIARIQKKTKRKKGGVLYNIKKGKVGADNNALIDVLKILAKAEISSIPLDKLDSFEALVDIYGASKKTLDIQNVGADTKAALDIINSLDAEADADVKVEKVKKEKESEEYNLDEAVVEIKDIKADTDLISNKDSKKIAEELNLITDEDIKELVNENEDGTFDYSMVESLRSVMQNLSQGIVTPEANNILLEIKSNKAAKIVTKPFSKITLSGIKRNFKNLSSSIKLAITSKSPSGKNIILDKVRSNVASYIDDAFGNLNSTVIFDNTFGLLAKTYEAFKVNTDQGFSKIESAEKVLEFDGKGIVRRTARFGNSANKIVAKKYKIRLLQLAREHILNLDKNGKPNKKSPSAKQMIDATIEFYNKPANKNVYKNDLKILEQLVDEFTVDGEISLDKLESSLTKGEKKALSIYDEVNNSLAEKGLFTSSVIRSNRIDLLNGYSHRVVLSNETSAAIDEKAVEFSKASTKSGTFEGRTNGPKPISFDPSLSAQRGLQETNIDYFMTSKIREVMKTVNKVSKNMKAGGTDAQIQAADALKKSVEEVIKITYGETMRPVGVGEMFLNRIKRNAYQAILAGVPRMGIELASNLSFAMANPKAALLGFKKFSGLAYLGGKKGADILNNLGSSETTKQYNAKTFTSRFADMSNFAQSSPDSMRAKSGFMNVLGILGRLGPKQTISAIDQIAGAIISTPDRAMTRPMWYGTFALKFQAETGIELSKKDFIEIGEGTSKYLSDEYSDAVKKSTAEADRMGVRISSSQNPFKGVIKNMRRNDPNQPMLLNTYRAINKFMATFSLFEYGTVRNAAGALQRSGDMSKKQAVGIMAAATVRMTMYPLLLSLVSDGFDELFTDAEYEEDDSSIEDMITRQTIGTVLTLMTRRSMGNIPNLLPAFGIEKFNEYMLGDFREGEYDPFKHSITFSQFNEGDLKKKGLIETAIGILSGPMGPIIKTLQRSTDLAVRSITNKTEESREKNKKELTNRMALEVMGNLGLIPFYKDVRRVVMKELFEDDVIKRRKSKKTKERKQYLDFLKDNDPKEYRYQLRQDKLKNSDKISSDVIGGGDVIKQ